MEKMGQIDTRPLWITWCERCGESYLSRSDATHYCDGCRKEIKREHQRDWMRKNYVTTPIGSIITCAGCGKEITKTSGRKIYCPECAKRIAREKTEQSHERTKAARQTVEPKRLTLSCCP